MDLTDIHSPTDIKTMNTAELTDLADQIRSFLISSISHTGGHLASNLGVVELTIALHYVFDSPKDKIFFDVGHQSYTHKILTGRAGQFSTLRQYDGLSGFEKRKESIHDVWEAGHSSTSLSAALGMAVARDLRHEHYQIVPVIGDGSLCSGMSFEALNQIGEEKRNMVIVINDNNMSISKNVGAAALNFARLRSSKGYNHFKDSLKENLKRNNVGSAIYSGLKIVKDSIKENIVDKGIFGEFNLEYMGPVDGHNIRDLIQTLEIARKYEGPVVVHVITKKGKGYLPCEEDRDGRWHGVGPFNVETGMPLHETPAGYVPWSELFSDTVLELADKEDSIVAITPAMIQGSHLQKFFAKYPHRSFDCGIAEEHATTFAAGMAINGLHPYLCLYSSFLQRAYDQINHDICRMDLPVVIGIDHAGLVGADGETHHGVFDIGLLKPIPHLILAQPCNATEARQLLYTAFSQKHPFAIRYPKGVVRKDSDTSEVSAIEVGTWTKQSVTDQDKVLVLTYGPCVETIYSKCVSNALPVTVVNCRFFKPMDEKMLIDLAEKSLPMIIYETDMMEGGLGESILSFYNRHSLSVDITTIGIGDRYVQQGSESRLRKDLHIDLNTLLDTIAEKL